MTPDEWLDRCPSRYDFMDNNNSNSLIDTWRVNNLLLKQFTWANSNGRTNAIVH